MQLLASPDNMSINFNKMNVLILYPDIMIPPSQI